MSQSTTEQDADRVQAIADACKSITTTCTHAGDHATASLCKAAAAILTVRGFTINEYRAACETLKDHGVVVVGQDTIGGEPSDNVRVFVLPAGPEPCDQPGVDTASVGASAAL